LVNHFVKEKRQDELLPFLVVYCRLEDSAVDPQELDNCHHEYQRQKYGEPCQGLGSKMIAITPKLLDFASKFFNQTTRIRCCSFFHNHSFTL
jgi:hypothetical protein